MGIIKKVAAVGAMAAVTALAANRKAVKQAVRGLIGSGRDKVDALADRADKSLAPEAKKVARVVKKIGAKKPRAARRAARRAVHAS
jgi:hypothetical protein